MYSEDRGRRRKDPWPFIGWPWAGSRATALGHTVSNREQFRKNRTPSAGIWAREGGSIWSVKFLIGGRGGYADGPHSSILKMTGGWVGQEGEAGGQEGGRKSGQGWEGGASDLSTRKRPLCSPLSLPSGTLSGQVAGAGWRVYT